MNYSGKIIAYLFLSVSLIACSGTPLQTKRLDQVQINLEQAKAALQRSQIGLAKEAHGEASAYLLTARDNKKYMSEAEKKRYEQLKQSSEALSARLKQY